MKRTLLSSAFAALLTASLLAAPISRKEAISIAGDFLKHRGLIKEKLSETNKKLDIRHSLTAHSSNSSYSPYYIVNIEDGGYVVVAGDDRARPVLAYSLDGRLDEADMPDACRYWLTQYSTEINSLESGNTVYNAESTSYTRSGEPMEPLIKTKWDQKYPYFLQCPKTENDSRCVTGCVATALAQVMKYHSYPARATGKIEYTDNTQKTDRSLDFSTMDPFDWENMLDTYSHSSPTAKCNAVANLMKAVGYGVKMQYSPSTSISYYRNAVDALTKYFGYDPNIHVYERSLMSAKEWEEIILKELRAGRPMIYDGHNPDMGHTFVCDGYDGEGMFHFNWGWSGKSDGYFSLSALNPGEQSTGGSAGGYNDNQAVICRIAPPGSEDSEPPKEFLLTIYILYIQTPAGSYKAANFLNPAYKPYLETELSESQFFFHCFYKGNGEFNGEVCAAVKDGDGIKPIVLVNPETIPGGGYVGIDFPLKNVTLDDGTYKMGFYYRRDDTDSWHRICATPDQPMECYMTIEGNKVVLAPIKNPLAEVSGIEETVTGKTEVKVEPGIITVTSQAVLAEVSVFNMNGQKIKHLEPKDSKALVDASSIPSGIYVIYVRTAEGEVKTLKVKI